MHNYMKLGVLATLITLLNNQPWISVLKPCSRNLRILLVDCKVEVLEVSLELVSHQET